MILSPAMRVALCLAAVLAWAGPSVAQDDPGLPNLVWLDPPRDVPDVAYRLEGGAPGTLEEFAGRAVVLNFWATWCPPCLVEMPSIDRLAAEHGGEDLAVVAMAMDRADDDRIRAFYERIDASHLGIYRDPNMKLARAARVFGLPTTLLISHEGKIVAQLVGEAVWDSRSALAVILPLAEAARQAREGAAGQVSLER